MSNPSYFDENFVYLYLFFCGFPGYKPVPPGWFKICVLVFYDGNTQRLTKSDFMEEPGIKPATPGLQDIGLSPTPWRLVYY